MSEHCLNLSVTGDRILCDTDRVTADSVAYMTAAFTFDTGWDTLYKTAVFRVGELVYHTPLENDCCTVPYEALTEGILAISVFGVLDTTRATTNEVLLTVEASGYVPCEPTAPSPDPYAYFVEQVTALKQETAVLVEEGQTAAETATQAAKTAENAKQAAQTAEQYALAAEHSAEEAATAIHAASTTCEQYAAQSTEQADVAKQAAAAAIQAEKAATSAVLTEIEQHNADENALAHPQLQALAKEAKSIALGKANSLCFDTEADLTAWIAGTFEREDGRTTADLKVGDNLYILDLGVPDYWWDGTTVQPLGAERPDLTDYYTRSEIDARIGNATFSVMARSDYDTAYSAGTLDAGKIYFVVEEDEA